MGLQDTRRAAVDEIRIAAALHLGDQDMPPEHRHTRRVVLLDGTIIHERAAASGATTSRSSKVADRVGG